jgi:hypothetical protein
MKTKGLSLVALGVSVVAVLSGGPGVADDRLSDEEALRLGTEAYIYGYPLVT